MIVLDTNIISEFTKIEPNNNVLRWLRFARLEMLYTCSPVINELWYGAKYMQMKTGSSRLVDAYHHWLNRVIGPRVLVFDNTAAIICAELRASGMAMGRAWSPDDAMIAAICIANGATLATRNTAHFETLDLPLANPFEPA